MSVTDMSRTYCQVSIFIMLHGNKLHNFIIGKYTALVYAQFQAIMINRL